LFYINATGDNNLTAEKGNMGKVLWRLLVKIEILPLLLFISVAIIHKTGIKIPSIPYIRFYGIFLFVCSVTFGAALPIFIRTAFYNRFVTNKSVLPEEYTHYQSVLMALSSVAVVSASLAYLLVVSPLYLYGSTLAAIYGIYSVIPFQSKIEKELSIYKLQVKN
jgi:hypothetical protein